MVRRFAFAFLLAAGLSLAFTAAWPKKISFSGYHRPEEVRALLESWASANPQLAKFMVIGKSHGLRDIAGLRLAAPSKESPDPETRPAVLVAANIEGTHLIGTEAALKLAERLLTGYGSDKAMAALLESKTIYLLPLLNPDAAAAYFASPKFEKTSNSAPLDEDIDGRVDEDGPDDLNRDGLITEMRVKDPEGKWMADPKEPRLMRLADPKKGERGIYKIYVEGLDNDGDGEYNEDPPGGVELNRNFPHDFEYGVKTAGLWPVSEKETIALLEFLLSHRNIALVLNFSGENTILNLQQTGQARVGADKVRVPRQFAAFLGLDPQQEYTLKEIVDVLKATGIGGGMEITEEMVASFLGLGPAVTIDRQDLPLFETVQKDYKDALKEAKIDYPESRAKPVGKGSFAAYCYYQYGVPVFSSDLWKVPEPKKEPSKDAITAERLRSMSSDDFLALGEEKISAFLKEQGAPPNFTAEMVVKMVKSGQVTPARMAEMMEKMPKKPTAEGEEHPEAYVLRWADAALKGKGFIDWTPFKHPTLGDVEIGGFVPYLRINPPAEEVEKTISFHVDFYLKLIGRLACLEIVEVGAKELGPDLFQVTTYVRNPGWFPTSTAQGRRALTAWPIRVQIQIRADQALFSGRPVETIPFLEGSGGTQKVEWTVKAKKGSSLTVLASSPRLGSASKTLVLK